MKSLKALPDGYSEIYNVNLQKDKKAMLLINAVALILVAALAVPMCFIVPISALFSMEDGFIPYVVRFASVFVLSFLYIILHELVHGAAMKICGTEKVKYGFTGFYAYAGSTDYYGKGSYIFIALSPIVLLGIIIGAVNLFVPTEWFWVIYFLQIFNISGAAGDLYVTVRFSKMPKDILVSDSGVGMRVFSKQ